MYTPIESKDRMNDCKQTQTVLHIPMIWPIWPIETFRGTARVAAPVLRRFAVNQLNRGGIHANAKDNAMMKNT